MSDSDIPGGQDNSFMGQTVSVRRAKEQDAGLLTTMLYFSILMHEHYFPDIVPSFTNAQAIYEEVVQPAIAKGYPVLIVEMDDIPAGMLAWTPDRQSKIEFRWETAVEVAAIAFAPKLYVKLRTEAAKLAAQAGIERVILQCWYSDQSKGLRGGVFMLNTNEANLDYFSFPSGGSIFATVR